MTSTARAAVIRKDAKPIGRATSRGYGWRMARSLALVMLDHGQAAVGNEVDIVILGTSHKAVVIFDSPFDPENNALRS